MAAADVSGAIPVTVSDEERRWMIVGICLTKVLTPALRDILNHEIPLWYQTLLSPPNEIDKQTSKSHLKKLPPSTISLNYESINNNSTVRKPAYDYAVKDPVSLAKLFVKPFMANFTGFDLTMDTSVALSLIAEAAPFHAASGTAKTIRSDVRNEWAHCNFSQWTKVKYETALHDMETLINQLNLPPPDKKRTLDDLDSWKQKGLELCFGQPVDQDLLKLVNTEVAELRNVVNCWKDDVDINQKLILDSLEDLEKRFNERLLRLEQDVERVEHRQLALYETVARRGNAEEPRYLFMAPKKTKWFSGRESELNKLRDILDNKNASYEDKVISAAVSGLGGSGKTSVTAEYTHKWKDYYQGGVYWFSGEDDVKLKASVDDIAAQFNTLHDNSFEATMSKTFSAFTRITKPWLMVVDDMDNFKLSQNLLKLVSGSWQENVSSFCHLIMTTRRTQQELEEEVPGFQESRCLNLECFGLEDAKNFVFKRTEIVRDEKQEPIADLLFQKLGGLPLALEQACAYIKYLGCTLSDYLESYEKQSLELLSKRKANSLHEITSESRLAVRTTWLLNFERIWKEEHGIIAIRFLNASAFMNPNEIQRELINVGKPQVDDKEYCEHVSSLLGSREVLKLLTDFSLFKETHNSSLTVHRLVQEVIRENLGPREKVESIVDAARLLNMAFSKCPSPDSLPENEVEHNDRPSLHSTDFSRFYMWHKFCLHAYEIKTNLEKFLNVFCQVKEKTVFVPEVARIVYECALHLNVNNYASQAKAVADFANRLLHYSGSSISEETLFPLKLPLSAPVRKHIQYSYKAPLYTEDATDSIASANDSVKSEIDTLRLEGNKLFKENNFEEAIKIYSSCIVSSKETDSFDPMLLSNRASAYLRLKQYSNALTDAEEFIKCSPECWRGYARKALALRGLKKKWDAACAAALAFHCDGKIFQDYQPFKDSFPDLKQLIHVCDNVSSLVALLSQCSNYAIVSDMASKIIVLEPGEYSLTTEQFHGFVVEENTKQLRLGNVFLVGRGDSSLERGVTLSFAGNLGLLSHNFMAVNLSFVFELGMLKNSNQSVVKLVNCSMTSDNLMCALLAQGTLDVKNCRFFNCEGNALCVAGNCEVEDSVFSGNKSVGLKVVGPGRLVLNRSKLHGNQWGLDVLSATCDVTDCQVYDNKKIGICVGNGQVQLRHNEIFHNDRHGIYLCKKAIGSIEENEIFQNGGSGISTMTDACCRVSHNKIYQNKCSGVNVVPIASDLNRQSVVEFNEIFSNEGPGIDQDNAHNDEVYSTSTFVNKDKIKAKCTGNVLKDNIDDGMTPPSHDIVHVCFFCHKKPKNALQKCTRCFTAEYCNRKCKEEDWKKHKNNCAPLLKKHSVLAKIFPLSVCLIGDKIVVAPGIEVKAPFEWLEPSGPEYEAAPEEGKRFIVKIQACDTWRKSNDGGTLLAIEDRSLTINGDLDINKHSDLYYLVRECGSNCNSYGWKKKFLWALLAEDKMVRIFISDFPPYQRW